MRLTQPPFRAPDLSDVRLLDSAYYASGDPHALWAYLREHHPVYLHDPGGGREPFWVLTRHHDVSRVLRDYESFTSRHGTMLCIIDLCNPDIASDQMMPDTDPPRHRKLREPVNRALTPRAVGAQEPSVRAAVRGMLRPGLDGTVFDLAQATMMLPMAFTGTLMGLPRDDWARMAHLTTMIIAYDDPDYAVGPPIATLRQAHQELFTLFREEVNRRDRGDPGSDLIGILMSMDTEDGPLTNEQIILNCYALLLGANATTPHVACTLVSELAARPAGLRAVRESPLLRQSCLEEALRWSSPASHFMRRATRDVPMNGTTIPAGAPVSVWLGSADRDERVFRDPYRFEAGRRPNRHVAFGVGPHFCIGAGLARLGLRVFFEEFVELVASVEPAGDVQHLASIQVAGYKRMPVRLRPRAGVTDRTLEEAGAQ
jgi:cytochrome P450